MQHPDDLPETPRMRRMRLLGVVVRWLERQPYPDPVKRWRLVEVLRSDDRDQLDAVLELGVDLGALHRDEQGRYTLPGR